MTKKEAIRYYLAGCVWGDGTFYKHSHNRWKSIEFEFGVSQHKRDKETLELFKKELGCGRLGFDPSNPDQRRYRVSKIKDLVEKVIPYFDGILTGYKKERFEKWKKEVLEYYKNRDLRISIGHMKQAQTLRNRVRGNPAKNNLTLPLHK